jgi:hypothetical protein
MCNFRVQYRRRLQNAGLANSAHRGLRLSARLKVRRFVYGVASFVQNRLYYFSSVHAEMSWYCICIGITNREITSRDETHTKRRCDTDLRPGTLDFRAQSITNVAPRRFSDKHLRLKSLAHI